MQDEPDQNLAQREPAGYWFPAKRYGWGWGLPNCWQGWVVTGAFFALLLLGGVFLRGRLYPCFACALAAGLIAICWAKGERPRWRWGQDSDD